MKHHPRLILRRARLAFNLSLSFLWSVSSSAAVFNIDSSRSSISRSGSVLGFAYREQRPGSLTTQFAGTINANATDASLVFTGSSLVAAQNSGNWEPKANGEPGSDPANYGGKASAGFLSSALAAVRNVQLDVTSPPLPLTGGKFDSGSVLFHFESAFGLKPASGDPPFAPLKASLAQATPGSRVLEFIRPKSLTGVSYQLLASDDLKTWTALNATPEITDLGGGQEKVVVRDTSALASNRGRFVVLTISKN